MINIEYLPLYSLFIGFILDAFLGDPHSWPHPIKLFGNIINYGEKRLNKGTNKFWKGAFMTSALLIITWFVFYLIISICNINSISALIINSVFVYYGLANHCLIKEGLKVNSVLEREGLEAGRKQLSYIVGRDTSKLNEQQIRTAVLETLAENLSDGVIAPLFFYMLGGVPAMLTYKMINTLDSMIGYKNERYIKFGKFAAIVDDIANYIPARLTAFMMALGTMNFRAFSYISKYGNKHASPNSGYPESAMAGILNCRFGGPNIYHGKLLNKPFIGTNDRELTSGDVKIAAFINAITSILAIMLICIFYLFRY